MFESKLKNIKQLALQQKFIVAVDGTAGSGKTTLAKELAALLEWDVLLTGLHYRYIAKLWLAAGPISKTALLNLVTHANIIQFNATDLEGEELADLASQIAADPEVRPLIEAQQRRIVETNRRSIIVEGRGIGNHLLPEAHLKLFLTTDINIRAKRRAKDLLNDVETIQAALLARDQRDMQRAISPLAKTKDGISLDSREELPKLVEQCLDIILKLNNSLYTS